MHSEYPTPKAAMKTWRASIIRAKLNRLGRVYAADRVTAEKVAAEEFKLDDEQRKRLIVEEVF
jgi:hypothetical protein